MNVNLLALDMAIVFEAVGLSCRMLRKEGEQMVSRSVWTEGYGIFASKQSCIPGFTFVPRVYLSGFSYIALKLKTHFYWGHWHWQTRLMSGVLMHEHLRVGRGTIGRRLE